MNISVHKPTSLLLVDDDRLIVATLSNALAIAGYQVSSTGSVDKAEIWLEHNSPPDLVILDVRMPGRSGLELAKHLTETRIPFMLLTAYSEQDIITRSNELGAMGYLVKPVNVAQMIPTIENALSRANYQQKIKKESQQLQSALDGNRELNVAIGIVMTSLQVGRDDAMKILNQRARTQHIKLAELSSIIISAREALAFEDGQLHKNSS